MAKTVADVLTVARYYIQDVREPFRQTDAELQRYLEMGLAEMFRRRPDLFASDSVNWCDLNSPELCGLGDALPIADGYAPALAFWVAANAELKDDEHVDQGRSEFLFNMAYRSMQI